MAATEPKPQSSNSGDADIATLPDGDRAPPFPDLHGARLSELLDAIDLAVLTLDSSNEILIASRAAEQMLGYGPGELVGMPLSALSDVAALQLSGLSRRETPLQILCRANRKDGSGMQLRIEGRALHGGVQDAMLVLNDLRGRQQVLEPSASNSQLAALGQIATGLVHELAQPLTVVCMVADSIIRLVDDGKADPGNLRGQLGLIAGQAQRMARIIDHMRMFARVERIDPLAFDLRESVRTALALLEREFRQNRLSVILDLPEDCPCAIGLPLRLEQVLVNLFTNAQDAILQDAPRHEDEAAANPGPRDQDGPVGVVRVKVTALAGNGANPGRLEIVIGDSGPGISERHLAQIFEPFFTTRPRGKGTGLGLTLCAALIADMGGSISVRNSDSGAEFVVLMPAAQAAAGLAADPQCSDASDGAPI